MDSTFKKAIESRDLDALWSIARRHAQRGFPADRSREEAGTVLRYVIPFGVRRLAFEVTNGKTSLSADQFSDHKHCALIFPALAANREQLTMEEQAAFAALLSGRLNGPPASYIHDVLLRQVRAFTEATTRMLRSFDSLGDDVNRKAEEMLSGYVVNEDSDHEGAAEDAGSRAEAWATDLSSAYLAILNLFAVGQFHLFEQHANELYATAGRNVSLNRDIPEMFELWLGTIGIDVSSLPQWKRIVPELEAVANTIKHAEGPSAEKLRVLRPDLFGFPGWESFMLSSGRDIRAPLTGEDIYVTEDRLKDYTDAIVAFWTALAERFEEIL